MKPSRAAHAHYATSAEEAAAPSLPISAPSSGRIRNALEFGLINNPRSYRDLFQRPRSIMSRIERSLIALAAFLVTAVIGYAAVRGVELCLFPQPNPAAIVWSERSGFLWRSAIALYIGGMGAFGGYALASRSPALATQWLARAVLIAAAAITIQGALIP